MLSEYVKHKRFKMSYITHKILITPTDFEYVVQEITVPECDAEMPLGKRVIKEAEVEAKWTKEEFIKEMARYGYETAAQNYIDQKGLYKEI